MPRRITEEDERRNRLQIMLRDDEIALLRKTAAEKDIVVGVYARHLMLSALKCHVGTVTTTPAAE